MHVKCTVACTCIVYRYTHTHYKSIQKIHNIKKPKASCWKLIFTVLLVVIIVSVPHEITWYMDIILSSKIKWNRKKTMHVTWMSCNRHCWLASKNIDFDWLSCWPDLIPPNYFLWDYLKGKVSTNQIVEPLSIIFDEKYLLYRPKQWKKL